MFVCVNIEVGPGIFLGPGTSSWHIIVAELGDCWLTISRTVLLGVFLALHKENGL